MKRLFDSVTPFGVTNIGEKMETLMLAYLARIEKAKDQYDAGDTTAMSDIKPVNYIILTDGAPSKSNCYSFLPLLIEILADDPEAVIISAARRLDARHFPLSQAR